MPSVLAAPLFLGRRPAVAAAPTASGSSAHAGSTPEHGAPDALRERSPITPSTRDDDVLSIRWPRGRSPREARLLGPLATVPAAPHDGRCPRRVTRARARGPRVPVGILTRETHLPLLEGAGDHRLQRLGAGDPSPQVRSSISPSRAKPMVGSLGCRALDLDPDCVSRPVGLTVWRPARGLPL